ncbi:hypothetical protein ACI75Y_02295 [Capnocytophaga stomatis]|uniref:hypothetical protein n=1 Tax=Capnocytophaga stomatis TaxID=1848904 RepID=UPI00385B6023
MAKDNYISIEFSQEELDRMDNLLSQLEEIVKEKFISLTTEERMEHARVGNKTEDWISRVRIFMEQYPDLVLRHINVEEFNRDYKARQALLPRLRRLQAVANRVDDTALLLGSDLHHNAITYYKGLRAMAQTNAPNAKTIYDDLKTQFPGRPSMRKKDKDESAPQ